MTTASAQTDGADHPDRLGVLMGVGLLFDAATAGGARRSPNGQLRHRLTLLTDRERLVLQLFGEGLSNREIAERLRLEATTVKNYLTHLLAKLHLVNRTQAAILVTQLRDGDEVTGR